MKMNEVIRKYRKEKNLTQEQIANYLGVTAPAVNKWESGASYPDITLIPALARILNISIDKLFSYKEDLTDIEINNIVKEISLDIKNIGYKETFIKVENLVKEYPNSMKFIFFIANTMGMYLNLEKGLEIEIYENIIERWLEKVSESNNIEIAHEATMILCKKYINRNQFDRAKEILDKQPSISSDKRFMEASYYNSKGEYNRAYEKLEHIIFHKANEIMQALLEIVEIKIKENKITEAKILATLSENLSESLGLGTYMGNLANFRLYMETKDVENLINIIKKIFEGLNDNPLKNSVLYTHMKMNEKESLDEIKGFLKSAMMSDELDFLRENNDFKEWIKNI